MKNLISVAMIDPNEGSDRREVLFHLKPVAIPVFAYFMTCELWDASAVDEVIEHGLTETLFCIPATDEDWETVKVTAFEVKERIAEHFSPDFF